MGQPWRIEACSLPPGMGATVTPEGVEFAVFSRHGGRIDLCLFDDVGEREIARLPLPCRSGDIHHGLVPGAGTGLRYALRTDGPWRPEQGHRFDHAKLLVDPYATCIDRPFRWDERMAQRGIDTVDLVPRCIVGDVVPHPAAARETTPSFIYELAVKSFSMRHPAVPERLRGTLPALTEPAIMEHLARLGVSHVELMPVAAWMDERHLPPLRLGNAWGYNPVNFFALDPCLAPGGEADLRDLCTAYRAAGIGVILDIVLNHTAESDEQGATICLRGLDNAVYYRHAADDPGRLINDTGCGHTLALDRTPVVRMATDALRRWRSLGVAGFRFDLGTVMGRSDTGFSVDAPLFAAILQDPELSNAILIAEPWDIGPGGYRLGEFPAPFAEWNGRYRDDVRRFWRGDAGAAGAFATRLAGSADLYALRHRGPGASINFVSAHDGFTLADLVAYASKHNEANGEGNRDGDNDSHSWNNGLEGPTDDSAVKAARDRDIRSLLATLFLSRGIPMLQAGDELGRTQFGNNNAYCQDNAGFWLDWESANEELITVVEHLSQLRRKHAPFWPGTFLTGLPTADGLPPDALWLKADGSPIGSNEWSALSCFVLILSQEEQSMLVAINRGHTPTRLALPAPRIGKAWRNLLNSSVLWEDMLPPRSVSLLHQQ